MKMKVRITGTIVNNDDKWIYSLYDIDNFAPSDLHSVLDDMDPSETVDIEINSPGGYVNAGSEIYTALINHKGDVNVTITGIAASMASVVAMAGTHVAISPTARFMIHNASVRAAGDYRDFQRYAEQMKKTNDVISNAYMLKTNLTKEKLLSLMDDETWITPDEAIEMGFADEILNTQQDEFQFVAGYEPKLLPDEVMEKARMDIELEKLELLKIKEM